MFLIGIPVTKWLLAWLGVVCKGCHTVGDHAVIETEVAGILCGVIEKRNACVEEAREGIVDGETAVLWANGTSNERGRYCSSTQDTTEHAEAGMMTFSLLLRAR